MATVAAASRWMFMGPHSWADDGLNDLLNAGHSSASRRFLKIPAKLGPPAVLTEITHTSTFCMGCTCSLRVFGRNYGYSVRSTDCDSGGVMNGRHGQDQDGCCCASDRLTEREVQILTLAATGLSDGQIGRKLHVSRHTVSYQISNAMRRCGASNRTELVSRCYASEVLAVGWWPPEPTGRRCLSYCESRSPEPVGNAAGGAPA
jgi:DNA-binding CsgD family transcriptional regulator